MKILRIIIKDPDEKVIRNVKLAEFGTSVVYGKVNKPENIKETSNSIGKSLFLKFCDYILGANEDNYIVKEKIHGWILLAEVKFKESNYNVERILGSSNTVVNGVNHTLEEYKEVFEINRNYYRKQVFVSQKSHVISMRNEPTIHDFFSFFKLLNLDELPNKTKLLYQVQDELKSLKKLEKQIAKLFNNLSPKEIKERIFLLNHEVKEKEEELKELNERAANINVNEEKMDLIESFSDKNYLLKNYKKELEKIRIESKRLNEFIDKSNKVDVTSNQIMSLYKKANIEIPEMINKRFEEVEEFHKTIFLERKETVNEQIQFIEEKKSQLSDKLRDLKYELDNMSKLISQNEAFKEAMQLYELKSSQLQRLMYEQGELNRVQKTIKEKEDKEKELNDKYTGLKSEFDEKENLIRNYRDYIYSLVKDIYVNKVDAYFSIEMRKKHQTHRPFVVDLNLTGDAGEGVGEIKKLLIDLLLFKFNNELEVMIHDSSCYSGGIDNRQIASVIKIADRIANETGKQFIVSINDFQLKKDDKGLMDLVNDSICLELDEDNKLMRFDFS